MIVGVGIDVVPVARFEAALRRQPGLADRLFTPAEQLTPSGRPRWTALLIIALIPNEVAPATVRALAARRRAGPRWRPLTAATTDQANP